MENLETVTHCIQRLLLERRKADWDSLRALRHLGGLISIAKSQLNRGEFGPWRDDLGISKEWAARLMKLDRHWKEIEPLLEAKIAHDPTNSRKFLSVDAAVAILNAR